ncbi:MAG: hypothetical protein IT205_10515 [Fimbriimonadaceae bacterium]|nr:hypothetical protein [Fimbriimonadaceae bacterium]
MGKNEKACGCGTNGLAKNGKFQKPLPTKSVEMKVGKGTMTRVGNQVIVGADAFPELREQLAASRNVRNAAPSPSELRSGVAGNILNLRKLPLPAEAANQILVNNRVGVFRFNTPPDGEGLAVNNLLIRPSTSLTVQSRLSRIQFLTDLNVPIAGAMNERANRSVFMGAMRVGASFGSRTLSEVGLVQVAEGKDTPKIGPKPEKLLNGVLVPSDP